MYSGKYTYVYWNWFIFRMCTGTGIYSVCVFKIRTRYISIYYAGSLYIMYTGMYTGTYHIYVCILVNILYLLYMCLCVLVYTIPVYNGTGILEELYIMLVYINIKITHEWD